MLKWHQMGIKFHWSSSKGNWIWINIMEKWVRNCDQNIFCKDFYNASLLWKPLPGWVLTFFQTTLPHTTKRVPSVQLKRSRFLYYHFFLADNSWKQMQKLKGLGHSMLSFLYISIHRQNGCSTWAQREREKKLLRLVWDGCFWGFSSQIACCFGYHKIKF